MSSGDQTLEIAATSDDGIERQALLSEAGLSGLVDDEVEESFFSEALTTARRSCLKNQAMAVTLPSKI